MRRTAFSPHDQFYINHLKCEKKYNMSVQHYHDAYEIYLQLDGTRYLFYDNICYTLKQGDIAIFSPFEIHYAQSRESDYYERGVINFHKEKLSSILSDDELFFLFDKLKPGVIHTSENQLNKILEFFNNLNDYSKKSGFLSEKLLYSELIQLLCYILSITDSGTAIGSNSVSAPVIAAIEFINKNYMHNLSLDEICTAIGMSKFHLCRTFKSSTGATVMEYLNNLRLTKVHSMLFDTACTLEEIAEKTGYMSAVNLNRAFKKIYGMSPRQFRKTLPKDAIMI